ncbi:MAG: PEGA domain-containing protein [Sedimentisphaerales bacterium]|nr:PEGA domain-containing protein [Sedimentisphaerales bacterium]
MNRKIFRQAMCIILAFMMFGCRSAYNLTLHSQPSGAIVQVGPDDTGRTPCNIQIPKDSDLIKNHNIDIKYILEDGREVVKSYDLRKYEPPGELASYGAAIVGGPGLLLLYLAGSHDDDEYSSFDKEDSNSDDMKVILVGLGLIALGGLTYIVLGGDTNAQFEYEIYENFADVNEISTN